LPLPKPNIYVKLVPFEICSICLYQNHRFLFPESRDFTIFREKDRKFFFSNRLICFNIRQKILSNSKFQGRKRDETGCIFYWFNAYLFILFFGFRTNLAD